MLSSKTLLKILNEILDFNKIESNMIELEETSVNLSQLGSEIVSLMQPAADDKAIQLNLEVSPSTPKLVSTDPVRLTQVLLNLCGNAIKFTHKGGVTIAISPDKSTPENPLSTKSALESHEPSAARVTIHFSITDSGVGIKTKEGLFTPFKQEDASTTRKFGGTGLGLAISKRLIDLMGGSLKLKSEYGKGSCFSFTLILPVIIEENNAALPISNNSNDALALHGKNSNILVVEDNKINHLIAEDMLSQSGFKVTVVENGQEALDIIQKQSFDLILMDIQMPVMDGETATRHLKSNPDFQHIPVVAMTANVMSEQVENYYKIGFSGFIGKPFIRDDMLKTLKDILNEQRT